MLDVEHLVHALETQAALTVQEVGDVGLLEAGLFGEVEAGEFAFVDALPESLAQIFLQSPEFHGQEYSTAAIAIRYTRHMLNIYKEIKWAPLIPE